MRNKKFKNLVRARMAQTGQKYSTARLQLLPPVVQGSAGLQGSGATSQLKRLAVLKPIPRTDTPTIRGYFSTGSDLHPGRMRVSMAQDVLGIYLSQTNGKTVVVDPLVGVGSVGVAAATVGANAFVGVEIVDVWAQFAHQAVAAAAATVPAGFGHSVTNDDAGNPACVKDFSLMLTSPPYPNAHSQGGSPLQIAFRKLKSTHAGNDFQNGHAWGLGSSPNETTWKAELGRTLTPWLKHAKTGTPILVHVKNYIRGNIEVRVDEWVREVLEATGLVSVKGYHPAPLGYRSGFQEWRRFQKQKIVKRTRTSPSMFQEDFACGHSRLKSATEPRTSKGICRSCGPDTHLVEVREDRIVVAIVL